MLSWNSAVVSINSLERDRLRQAEFSPSNIMDNRPNETLIPDRSQAGLIMTAPTASHWGVGDKYTTGGTKVKKIRGRENISIGTWNMRTLRADFTSKLVHGLAFGTPKFYIATYGKLNHGLVNQSSNCDVKSGLRPAGKLEELVHEMDMYHWNILGLCEKLEELW